MASRASIVMYYDLISPYTFIGFKMFNRVRQQWSGVDVTFKPMLLGGVMNVTYFPFLDDPLCSCSTPLPPPLLTNS